MNKKNHRAEVGETITWIFATIIIIAILLISIFISTKFFKRGNYESFPRLRTSDIFVTKSLAGYLLTKDNSGEVIFNEINAEGDLNDFNGLLSNQIFLNLYKTSYPKGIWIDIDGKDATSCGGSIRSKYYKYDGKSCDIPTDTDIEERIYFGEVPDNFKTKNLILFLRK